MTTQKPLKQIIIDSCQNCPFYGNCPAFRKLTPKQRTILTISNAIPSSFMLKDCPLDDMKELKQ